jgi:hypothetical protein
MDSPLDIVQQLRNRREMVNWGNGNVTDEPDGLCEEAADEIGRLRAVLQEIADLRYDNASAATIAQRALTSR